MSANQPTVSIITICLNDKVGLKKTIESVKKQTFKDFEHLIIDGGSNDGSEHLLEEHKDYLVNSISEKDTGRYNAMNKGIIRSKGKYCLFLNAGDYLHSDNVLNEVFSTENTEDILYGNLLYEDKGKFSLYRQPESINLKYLMDSTISHPASFIKKTILDKFGYYDESYIIAGDYELFLRLVIAQQASTKYLPITISVFNNNGISNNDKYTNILITERKKAQASNVPTIFLDYYIFCQHLYFNNFEAKMSLKIKKIPALGIIQKITMKIIQKVLFRNDSI